FFLILVENHLRIGSRFEAVSFADQLFPQFDMVEDFAVEGDPETPCPIVHGLIARSRIDDTQARVRESDVPVGIDTFAVGSAMTNHLDHGSEWAWVCSDSVEADKARYSAHLIFVPFRNPARASYPD